MTMEIGSIRHSRTPFCQAFVQRLPYKKGAATRALGLLSSRRTSAVVNGYKMRLDLREMIQQGMFSGSYEPTQTSWFKQCLRPGDILIDVGASFGYYTTLGASLVGTTGQVFAFEPSPIASDLLEEMITNSMAKNIILTKAAVGKETGNVTLYLPVTRHLHSPSILESDPSFVPIEVPLIKLDDFAQLEDVPSIRLVKIDVEGYEPDVLSGMEGLIKEKRIENIICEFNSGWLKRNSMTPKQLYERFLDLGFKIHAQTKLEKNLVGHRGELFDLQDLWLSSM